MKKSVLLAVAFAVAVPSISFAQFAKPEDAVRYRKAALTVMASHFGRIGAVVKGDRPFNAQEVQANAALVETMSTLPWAGFGAATDKIDSKAKPEVWSQADKFKTAQDTMIKAVADLSTASKSGNLDAVKAAFGGVGKTCKGCHDDFRKE